MIKRQINTMVYIVFTTIAILILSGCQDPTSVESTNQNITEK